MKSVNCFLIVLMCCITITSCSQNNASNTNLITDIFAGGTPCNSIVNTALKIPASDTCEYMKWELTIFGKDSSFKLLISYGAYQPNTMFFLNGGKSMRIAGKLKTTHCTRNNTKYKILHLVDDEKRPEVLFIELDNNILHLIDSNMKLIKGDPGMGFVLNRVNSSQTN